MTLRTSVGSHSSCLGVTGFFHSAQCPQGPPTVSQEPQCPSCARRNRVPLPDGPRGVGSLLSWRALGPRSCFHACEGCRREHGRARVSARRRSHFLCVDSQKRACRVIRASSTLKFLRTPHWPPAVTPPGVPATEHRAPIPLHPTLVSALCLTAAILVGVRGCLTVVWSCISLAVSAEYLLVGLVTFVCSLWGNVNSSSLPSFELFCVWCVSNFRNSLYILDSNLVSHMTYKYFLSFCTNCFNF